METETIKIKNYGLQDYVDAMLAMGIEFYELKKYVAQQANNELDRHVLKCNDIFETPKGELIFELVVEKKGNR